MRLLKIIIKRTQIVNIRNKTRVITTDPSAIERAVREDYEQFYIHILYNLEEVDQFLESHKLQNLNEDEIVLSTEYLKNK